MLRWVLALVLLCVSVTVQADIPLNAWKYRAIMTKSAYRIHGPSAPIPILAAQIHQESSWDCDAISWVGAQGCAQFMPSTANEMAQKHPADCAPANPTNPKWAFNCRDRYMNTLLIATANEFTTQCSNWAFALRAYNGGLGWIKRDKRLAAQSDKNPDNWIEVEPFNAGRGEKFHKENREYPRRIFNREELYAEWGTVWDCKNTENAGTFTRFWVCPYTQ